MARCSLATSLLGRFRQVEQVHLCSMSFGLLAIGLLPVGWFEST
jgi:hypothetical protein